jgi:hypothetical protein
VVLLLGSVSAQSVLSIVFGVLIADVLWALSGVLFTAVSLVTQVRLKRAAHPYAGDHG